MKRFAIYRHPDARIHAVKQGWSWPAFLFPWLWALSRQIWLAGLGGPVLFFSIGAALDSLVPGHDRAKDWIMIGVLLTMAGVYGRYGNCWCERRLMTTGYVREDVVDAGSASEAESRV